MQNIYTVKQKLQQSESISLRGIPPNLVKNAKEVENVKKFSISY